MLLFGNSIDGLPVVLFTGDILCPLLRKKDYGSLARADLLFIDCNNRFPYPQSNHISFTRNKPGDRHISSYLAEWLAKTRIPNLINPHQHSSQSIAEKQYWEEFQSDWSAIREIPHSILDLVLLTQIPHVYLMHYFGLYDRDLYGQSLLSPGEMSAWAQKEAEHEGLKKVRFAVPEVGELIRLRER